jgi:hypothetical protein
VNWRASAEPQISKPLSDEPWPVAARKLLTEREQSFYQSLLGLYPNHKVFIQVALSQLIDVPEDHPDRQSIRNRFSQLVADFVLCRTDLSVVAVIELDDRTHERPRRQDADARKNKALVDAGIRLVRIPAGPLPSEQHLRTLIYADGMGERIYPEEPVLTLAEDIYAPASSYDSDEASAISQEVKRVARKAVTVAVLVACGWLFYSYLLPTLMQQAFAPLAKPAYIAIVLPKSRVASKPITATPAVAPPVAELSAESRRARELEIAALGKQKSLAFAALYQPPASCEHPIVWSAQVECGNQYIRAKRAFELRWEAERPSRGSGAEIVLDNRSVTPAHQ